MKAIAELGFEEPSEIQREAIPQLIDGFEDFIGLAQTGTGKTAAFGLPLLERIDPNEKHTQALILAPTRELGQQIASQLELFSKYQDKINTLAVYGGAPIHVQIRALRKPVHIIIATPGRLIDLIQRKAIRLDKLDVVILDEADEMLNMGFKQDIDKILSYMPAEKLTWLFSATMSSDIKKIVDTYMEDPVEIRINSKLKVNSDIAHQFALVRHSDKVEAISRFIDMSPDMRGVIFCRTKRDTQYLAEELARKKYKADALHGDLTQRQRDKVMGEFRDHRLQILVATDIAARGIDVNDLTHVFHHSLPDDLAYYTHRAGRTGRAGKKGISLAFINGREKGKVMRLKRDLNIQFNRAMVPNADDIQKVRLSNWVQEVLEQPIRNQVEEGLLEKAYILFGNLSKEELIAKMLIKEMGQMSRDAGRDLNEAVRRNKPNYGGDGGRSDRRRNDRGDRDRYPRGDKKKRRPPRRRRHAK
ncbi:MAG: DEAD/DEAH box helicase [Bacteroidota bacterium]